MAISITGPSGNGRSGSVFGRRRFGYHASLAEMNVVPLVDVVLVLLIIFMLTAHVMEFGLEINVPEVKQVKDTTEELPVISLKSDGRLYLNETPVNINQVAGQVARRFKGAKEVFVSADEAAIWGSLAQVISALDEAKLGIKVVVKPEETNR
jgi:biopolymer transport protein ExbD